jgi:recombination protein RecR
MDQIKTIEDLIACYKKLPSIGSKSAERLAYATLELSEEERNEFIQALKDANEKVKRCPDCGIFFNDECPICSSKDRDHQLVMVVSSTKDIYSIEKTQGYNGTYFTLNGTLSPLKNRGPETIGINKLIERVKRDNVQELILALPTDLEGETTSSYIARIFKDSTVSVTRLAHGIPIGTNLEYLDSLTITQSIKRRIKVNEDK